MSSAGDGNHSREACGRATIHQAICALTAPLDDGAVRLERQRDAVAGAHCDDPGQACGDVATAQEVVAEGRDGAVGVRDQDVPVETRDELAAGYAECLRRSVIREARWRNERDVERAHDAVVNRDRQQESHRLVARDVCGDERHALAGGAGARDGQPGGVNERTGHARRTAAERRGLEPLAERNRCSHGEREDRRQAGVGALRQDRHGSRNRVVIGRVGRRERDLLRRRAGRWDEGWCREREGSGNTGHAAVEHRRREGLAFGEDRRLRQRRDCRGRLGDLEVDRSAAAVVRIGRGYGERVGASIRGRRGTAGVNCALTARIA